MSQLVDFEPAPALPPERSNTSDQTRLRSDLLTTAGQAKAALDGAVQPDGPGGKPAAPDGPGGKPAAPGKGGARAGLRAILAAWERVRSAAKVVWRLAAPVVRRVWAALKTVTGFGWSLVALGVVGWLLAAWFGWQEAGIVAVFCLLLVVMAALFTIGRTAVTIDLTVNPQRVFAGQGAMAAFDLANQSSRPLSPIGVHLPVGQAVARYTTPKLGPGETYGDWVAIPTGRRGVVPVGPISTYRDDPLGLVRRALTWTGVTELFIHPVIIPLDPLGAGLLRDLEGRPTADVSSSDLAFHALRDYVPGDDQRYIHWRSSARLSAAAGEEKFMVRQFLDTRQTHVGLICDLEASHYADEDEFELALSCAASVAVRALTDEMNLTLLCGDQVRIRPKTNHALDAYSRAELTQRGLQTEFERVRQVAPDASIVIVVTGSGTDLAELRRGRATVDAAIGCLALRVRTGSPIRLRSAGGLVELTVGDLDDLPRAMRGGLL